MLKVCVVCFNRFCVFLKKFVCFKWVLNVFSEFCLFSVGFVCIYSILCVFSWFSVFLTDVL